MGRAVPGEGSAKIPDMILVSVVVLLAAACASTALPVTQLPRPTATAAPLARSTVHEVVVPVSLPTATLVVFPTPTAMVTEPAVNAVVPTSTIEPQVPVSEAPLRYTVRAGDTLLGIAMAFDVPMAALQLENELGGATLIHLDQVLEIPAVEMWTDATPFWVVYEVEEGQTLGEIAALNGIGVADLLAANYDIEADRISVGQTLVLPLKGPQEMVVKVTEPEPSAAPPDAVSAAAAVVVEDVVPAEETLSSRSPRRPQPLLRRLWASLAWLMRSSDWSMPSALPMGLPRWPGVRRWRGPHSATPTTAMPAAGVAIRAPMARRINNASSARAIPRSVGLNVGRGMERQSVPWRCGWTRCRPTTRTGALFSTRPSPRSVLA